MWCIDHHPNERTPVRGLDAELRRIAARAVSRLRGDDAGADDHDEPKEAAVDGPCSEAIDRGDHLAIDRSDLFLQPRGSMSSTTSSTVTVPRSLRRASTTGSASRSYFAMSDATSSFGVSASTLSTWGSIAAVSFVSGGATTRSRSEVTPSSRPSSSTTYRL